MNKKILMLTLMLLAMLTLTIIPVQAAPKEKLDFTLYFEAPMVTDFDPLGLGHGGPKKSGGQDYPIQKTFHGRGISQDILLATITIGDDHLGWGWNITGDWEFLCANNPLYTHRYTITQTGGTFTGFGYTPATGPGTYELISGTINSVTGQVIMHGVYYSDSEYENPTGYTFVAAITINPSDGSMVGVLISQGNLSFVSTSGTAVYTEDFVLESVFGFEFNWKTLDATIKTKETIEFEDGSTIELSIIERGNYAMLSFEGTFVGHGTGALKDVKIVGTISAGVAYVIPVLDEHGEPVLDENDNPVMFPIIGFTREGTIMGWPTD